MKWLLFLLSLSVISAHPFDLDARSEKLFIIRDSKNLYFVLDGDEIVARAYKMNNHHKEPHDYHEIAYKVNGMMVCDNRDNFLHDAMFVANEMHLRSNSDHKFICNRFASYIKEEEPIYVLNLKRLSKTSWHSLFYEDTFELNYSKEELLLKELSLSEVVCLALWEAMRT